jgi:hypothetical protein
MATDKDFIYFVAADFKSITNITDDQDDSTINLLGHSADSQIDNELFSFAEQLPLIGIDLRTACSAALYYALSKWYAQKNNTEKATYFDTQYTTEVNKLTTKLIATHTSRSKRIAVSRDYDTEDTLFSQTLR